MSKDRNKKKGREPKPLKEVKKVEADIVPKDPETIADKAKADRKDRYERALSREAKKAVARAGDTDREAQKRAVADAATEARDTYESETGDAADVSVVVTGESADGSDEQIEVEVKSEKDTAEEK